MDEKYRARDNGQDPEKIQEQINNENNANTIKNAAEVAIATKNPYAVAAGAAVKGLDKATGGKSTEALGKVATKVFKQMPNGDQLQNLSNDLSESGVGDMIGSAASMKNGDATNAEKTNLTAGQTTNSSTSTNSTKNLVNNFNATNTNSEIDNEEQLPEQSKEKKSFSGNLINNDAMKLINTKRIIIIAGIFFFFIIIMTAVVSAKDHGNLDMTNNSQAMGSYIPESIGVATPGSISGISSNVMDGKNGSIMTGGQSLKDRLGEEGFNLLNQSIISSAQTAGYKTGAGVAAAAQALIQNLLNNNIVLPYFWGGGHGTISSGANANWGKYQRVSAGGHATSHSSQPSGLDCSGFVSWALHNGGCTNFSPITANMFKSIGPSTTFEQAKTGDIAASSSHVVLILENRGDKLLVAEAKGTAFGVVFTERTKSNLGNYKIVDMTNFYQTKC